MSGPVPSSESAASGAAAATENKSANRTGRRFHFPDTLLAGLLLVFAFLAASFPASNSDLWLHLATGRALIGGDYQFGTDPFGYTTEAAYWTNHAWLFDVALFGSYQALGGAGLVFLKALLVLAVAALMLRIARGEGPFWVSGGFVVLAILAMSPRLLLQPACVSILMLSLCLSLLLARGRARFAVLPVIALWVNLDSWFLLGPLLVLLFALGQRLSITLTEAERIPLWLIPASVMVCLISPHHYHSLTLPAELSPAVWNCELRHDVRFAAFFASPWSAEQLERVTSVNPSAWAYFALSILGVLSFAVNVSACRTWRLPVWLVFALLGAWQIRLVPFFAVLAGPIAALNFRERMADCSCRAVGRSVVAILTLCLIMLTWPGWLQGVHRRDRPLAWELRPDPSLQRVSATLARWRQAQILPAHVRTFANNPDVAHYLVWYCPGEKVFLDSRLTLFARHAADFERICQGIDRSATGHTEWEQILETNRVGCLIVYDPNVSRLAASLRRVSEPMSQWDLLSVDGLAVVVGRKGMAAGLDDFRRFNARRLAYGASDDELLGEAPGQGPAVLAHPFEWSERFIHQSSGSSWEAGAAAVYLQLFENGMAGQLERQRKHVVTRQAAGIVGVSALCPGPIPTSVLLGSRFALESVFLPDLLERPAELPLLAVRAARRAVAEHPDDGGAWITLAQACLWLQRVTLEGTDLVSFRPLAQLRHIQIATALSQAVVFWPDSAQAHEMLARLHAETRYFDLALRHRSIQLNLVRKAGAARGEDAAAFSARVARLEQAVEQMRAVVQDSENRFVVHSHALTGDPLARAKLALQLGLAGKAVDDVLLRSHSDLYGVEGLRLLLEVLLLSGRSQEARELLDREELRRNPDGLGAYSLIGNRAGERRWSYDLVAYDWFDLCQSAAAGQYEQASRTLEQLRARLSREGSTLLAALRPALAFRLASEIGLETLPLSLPLHFIARPEREQIAGLIVRAQFLPVETADLHVLEGMLLLERGRPKQAADQFRQALQIYAGADATTPALPGRNLAQMHLDRINSTK